MDLRQLRKTRGFYLKEVSHECGVSAAAIANYENGIREPSISAMEGLARVYNVDIGQIITCVKNSAKKKELGTYPKQKLREVV